MKNYHAPDEKGFFGEHGGLYVSETLIPALQELADAYQAAKNDPSFCAKQPVVFGKTTCRFFELHIVLIFSV